jgi:hypothetical protein
MQYSKVATAVMLDEKHLLFGLLSWFWKKKYAYEITLLSVAVSGIVEPEETFLGNGSVNTFPQQRTHTQQQNNRWTQWCFLCGPCRIKGKVVPLINYKHYAMKAYGGVVVEIHVFLTYTQYAVIG